MTQLCNRLEGVTLAGNYGLQQWLGNDNRGAFYRTTFGDEQRPALFRLVPDDVSAEEQLEFWRKAERFTHPNLLELLDFGRTAVDGEAFLYAVFEYPDDNLEGALEEGALSNEEKLEVLRAAREGLRYIHSHGMVHTAVDAAHIVAVGEQIKLTTETLRERSGSATPADDLRALADLFGHEAIKALDDMPPPAPTPMPTVVTPVAREAAPPAAIPITRPPAPAAPAVPIVAALSPSPMPPASASPSAPSTPAAPVMMPSRPRPAEPEVPRRAPAIMPLAAIAAVVVALILVITQKSGSDTPTAAAVPLPPPPVTRAAPLPPEKSPVTNVVAKSSDAQPREMWRVIAYTYSRYQDAEKKVRHINEKWSGFHAEVYAPKGRKSSAYFVSLGGRMSRADASTLQRKALGSGLPKDTFVRNFSN